jgi:hypothetical protein
MHNDFYYIRTGIHVSTPEGHHQGSIRLEYQYSLVKNTEYFLVYRYAVRASVKMCVVELRQTEEDTLI